MISEDKINYLQSLNNDNSRFILNVVKAYENKEKNLSENIKQNLYEIETKKYKENMINLDTIWADPYIFTTMRVSLDRLINLLDNTNLETIKANSNNFCKNIIYNKSKPIHIMPENMINIKDFIQNLDINSSLHFYSEEINEESIFKADQITKALILKNITSNEEMYSKLYDYVYNYLKDDFLANNYCDFINNKCIGQRHIRFYPLESKNGCCHKGLSKCKHFNKDHCNANCMACRLFSCEKLSKMGVTYYGREILLFAAFLNKKQFKHMIYDFFITKKEVISRLIQDEN